MSDEIKVIKENEEEQPQEELKEEQSAEELRQIEEFNNEEGIEFNQTIKKDDLVQYNYYLIKNGSNYFRTGLMVFLGLFIIGYSIYIRQHYWIIALGALLVIYSLFLHFPLQKVLIKNQVKKKPTEEYNIDVKFASKIKYQLADEESSPLVDYSNIYKVRKTPNYIFMHMGAYAVIIVKLDCCDKKEELVEFIKNKYSGTKKYKELKK